MEIQENLPENEIKCDHRIVKVIGNVTKDQVELYFESTRLSGGEVQAVVEETEQGVFLITFESKEEVQGVLNRAHKIGTEELEVCLHADIAPKPEVGNSAAESRPLCTIVVHGVASITNMELLEVYFENKRSGGGEIAEIKKDEKDVDVLYITYEEEEVARRVASRSHIVDERELNVRMLLEPTADGTSDGGEVRAQPLCTVIVKGVSQVSSRDHLEMYFESKKRSGGGNIEEIKMDDEDDDVAYITYSNESVAKAVARRPHIIGHVTLEVSLYVLPNATSVPSVDHVKTICVQTETPVSKDVIEMYFENKKRADGGNVECVDIDPDDAFKAYVTFEEEDVAARVSSRSHEIDGNPVKVSLWQPTDRQHVTACTIKVTGARHFENIDPLELYFENHRRSGGGDIVKIKRDEDDEDLVYVTFESEDVVKSVLERSSHRVNEQILKVDVMVPGQQNRKATSQKTK